MGKKLGLCIVYNNWNYGSILQSYATLLKLQDLNVDYEIIRYKRKKDLLFYFKSLSRLINKDLRYSKLRKLKRQIGKKTHPEFATNDRTRAKAFHDFVDKKFDHFTNVIDSYTDLQAKAKEYLGVLVGSDQLWLPSGLETNFFNLMFVPDNVIKIAYSASFGVNKIPFYQKEKTMNYLNRIDCISVREHSGQKIIKDLINRDVPVILDPTLIVEKECWDRNIPIQPMIDEDYIFCYFLGNNKTHREQVIKLSHATGLKIVTLRHMDEYIASDEKFGDYALYDIGPAEFINLIRNARYVCTDSFHGSVFSIINHKQFVTFERYKNNSKNSRNSRLDSLFGQLNIDRRFICDLEKEMNILINYDEVDAKLEKLRQISSDYLINSISKIGE